MHKKSLSLYIFSALILMSFAQIYGQMKDKSEHQQIKRYSAYRDGHIVAKMSVFDDVTTITTIQGTKVITEKFDSISLQDGSLNLKPLEHDGEPIKVEFVEGLSVFLCAKCEGQYGDKNNPLMFIVDDEEA